MWVIVAEDGFVDVECVVCTIVGDVFASAAGATASSLFFDQGGIFVFVAVPVAWNATNALYEFFVVFPVIVLGLILGLVGRLFCLLVVIVVLFISMGLDGAGAVASIEFDVRAAAGVVTSALVIFQGVIFIVVAVPIAWNATNTWYEFFVVVLFRVFFLGLGLILVPTRRRVCLVGVSGFWWFGWCCGWYQS